MRLHQKRVGAFAIFEKLLIQIQDRF